MQEATSGNRTHTRARRARRVLFRPPAVLRLFGELGASERHSYLVALGDDVTSGRATRREAVDELHVLSEPWMRTLITSRLRRLPPHADPQVTEHWLWMEWHRGLEQFDPARVDTFPGYMALRLRMAGVAAAREDDSLSRRERTRVKQLDEAESRLVQELGRGLTQHELSRLASAVGSGDAAAVPPRVDAGELADLAERAERAMMAAEPGPAEVIERRWLVRAVRAALARGPVEKRRRLVDWLESAQSHNRPPPRHLGSVPSEVREALAPWADPPVA